MKRILSIVAAMVALAAGADDDWVNTTTNLNGVSMSLPTGLYSNNSSVVITNGTEVAQAEIVINNPDDANSFTGTIAGNIKVVKKGAGTQNFEGSCLYSETVVESGTLYVSKEAAFGAWNADIAHKLTVCEGATFKSYRHLPLGEVVLKGGTLLSEMYSANVFNQTTPVSIVDPSSNYRAWALRTVTVEASEAPSLIRAFTTSLAHGSAQTVFDVQENAELQLDVELFPGKLTDTEMNEGSFVKRGKGTLKLLKPCNLDGTIIVEDGALVVSKNTWHDPKLRIVTKGEGRIVMEDEAALVFSTAAGLLASADIWVDAAQHQTPTGEKISHIKNLGTAGGLFRPLEGSVGADFVTDGINGKPSFKFNKWRGMGLDTYTNTTANMTVFMATRWDGYDVANSGAASFSRKTADSADDDTTQSFHWERGSTTELLTPLKACIGGVVYKIGDTGLTVGTPTVKMMSRTATSMKVWSYINDSAKPTVYEKRDTQFNDFNINVVAFGSRLAAGGKLISQGRNMNGLIGEMIVFTRVLNDDEIETIQTYLKRKWCGSTSGQVVKGFEAAESLNVEVGEGAKAVVMDGANARDDVMRMTTIRKSGAGTLAIGAIAGDRTKLVVDEGALELKDGKTLPQAEIWMDASDAGSVTTYEFSGTRAASVLNKGRTGGAFKYRDGSDGESVVNGPLYTTAEDGINDKPVLDFSMWNALVLNTYTNKNEVRNLHVYAVVRKPVWNWADKQGSANSGPFSFSRVDTGESSGDGEIDGVFYIMHKTHTANCTQWTNVVDCGNTQFNVFDRGWTNEAYIVICHATSKGIIYTQVTESDDTINLPICPSYNWNIEPLNVDLVQIGGRLGPNGHRYGANNRLWQGQMGEFIVFNQKPTVEQETELINYLRRKWFNKGDGSETPPVCLTGVNVAPVTTDSTALVLNEGATLRHEKGVQSLASLAAANNVTWQRPAATEGDFALFSVVGDISLTGQQTLAYDVSPKADMTLFTYGGVCDMTGASWILNGPKADTMKVKNFAAEKTVKVARNGGFLLIVR